MSLAIRLLLALLLVLIAESRAFSHERVTHWALTGKAVRYLAEQDARFSGVVEALSDLLIIGAEREDDPINSLIGRFFFHSQSHQPARLVFR